VKRTNCAIYSVFVEVLAQENGIMAIESLERFEDFERGFLKGNLEGLYSN
jgi:hypothetical protein